MPLRPETLSREELDQLQELLDEGDTEAQCAALTQLCPCRNRVYDRGMWAAILHAHECSFDHEVRDKAKHALMTLRDMAGTDPDLADLARWVGEREERALVRRAVRGQITPRDIPLLLDILEGGDAAAQCDALTQLCPCR